MHTLRVLLGAMFVVSVLVPSPAAAQAVAADESFSANGSEVGFTVYAQMLFKVKEEGRFRNFSGEVSYDPERPGDTRVDLTVYTATVDMHNPEHAAMLKSGDFFDVDRFPTMRFVSAATMVRPDGTLAVEGDLTIRGITKRIALPVTIKPSRTAGGAQFETTFQIDRTEFGLNGSPKFSGFKVSIAKNVGIHIAIATRLHPRE